jgi:hypothetical protein
MIVRVLFEGRWILTIAFEGARDIRKVLREALLQKRQLSKTLYPETLQPWNC